MSVTDRHDLIEQGGAETVQISVSVPSTVEKYEGGNFLNTFVLSTCKYIRTYEGSTNTMVGAM